IISSFSVLGYYGFEIYQQSPPIPKAIVSTNGDIIFSESDIKDGQNIWQSIGGQEVGSIWGHGSYVAPDWTADWLHREAVFILNRWAQGEFGGEFEILSEEQQAQLSGRLTKLLRTNTYDAATDAITIDPLRAEAFAANVAHYSEVFSAGRADYAIHAGAVTDTRRLRNLAAFFFWTSWAAVTDRPDDNISYTNN